MSIISENTFLEVVTIINGHPLNKEQKEAVIFDWDKPLFIVAGPGTGKTTVLTYRILKFVFVDGPPHASEHVQKEDREKRNKLESINFTVIELDFKDGAYKENPSLIEKEVLKLKEYLE